MGGKDNPSVRYQEAEMIHIILGAKNEKPISVQPVKPTASEHEEADGGTDTSHRKANWLLTCSAA